jgi:aspartate ammonia-lyase
MVRPEVAVPTQPLIDDGLRGQAFGPTPNVAVLSDSAVTSTALVLGHAEVARVAKLAISHGRTVSEIVQELGPMTADRFVDVTRTACTFSTVPQVADEA